MRRKICLPLLLLFVVSSCSSSGASGGIENESQTSNNDSSESMVTSETIPSVEALHEVDGATAKVKAKAYKTYLESDNYHEPTSYKTLISIKIRNGTTVKSFTNDLIRINHDQEKMEASNYMGAYSDTALPYSKTYLFKKGNNYIIATQNSETKTYKTYNDKYDNVLAGDLNGLLVPKGAIKANNLRFLDRFLQTDFTREDVIEKSLKIKGDKEMLYSFTIKGGKLTTGASSKTKIVFHIVDYKLEKSMTKVSEYDENNAVIEETLTQQQYVYQTQDIIPPTLDQSWITGLNI